MKSFIEKCLDGTENFPIVTISDQKHFQRRNALNLEFKMLHKLEQLEHRICFFELPT